MVRETTRGGAAATRRLAVWATVAVVVLAGATPFAVGVASAAPTPIVGCTTISTPGEYVLTADASSTADCIVVTSGDVVLDGGGFTVAASGPTFAYGITVGDGVVGSTTPISNVTVRNVVLTGWNRGVYFEDVSDGEIRSVDARDSFYGVYMQGSDRNLVVYNDVRGGSTGMFLRSSDDNVVSSNVVNGTVSGIRTENSVDNELTWNLVEGSSSNGINVFGGRTFVANNVVRESGGNGIRVSSSASTGSEVTGNVVSGSGSEGVEVGFARFVVLQDNVVSDSAAEGVFLASADDASLTNNTVLASAAADLRLTSSAERASVVDLTLATATVDLFPVGGVELSAVDAPPADPPGLRNVGEYVDVRFETGAVANLTVYYEEAAVAPADESDLAPYYYNGSGWTLIAPSVVDDVVNAVQATVTESGVVAPLVPAQTVGDDRFEENDDEVEATRLSPGTYENLVRLANDDDWYVVSATESERVDVSIRFDHGAGDLDLSAVEDTIAEEGLCYPKAEVADDGVNIVRTVTVLSNSTTDDESVTFVPDYGDGSADCGNDVLIRVYGKQPAAAADYTLVIAVGPAGPSVDVDDSGPGVAVTVTGATANQPVEIPLEEPVSPDVVLESLVVTTTVDTDYTLDVTTSESVPPGTTDLAIVGPGGTVPLGYVTVTESLLDAEVAEVRFVFRVAESALVAAGVDPDDVRLYRYTSGGGASELPTTNLGLDATTGAYVYEAVSPGLSVFGVAGLVPNVVVTGASANATELLVGETVAVTASVVNEGGVEGTATVQFTVDGTAVDSTTVTLGPGASTVVTFEYTFAAPGTYALAVDGVDAGTVLVKLPVDVDVRPDDARNVVPPSPRAAVPVAVLGTDAFDPTSDLVVESIRFGSAAAVDGGGGATAFATDVTDVNDDGREDLVLVFRVGDAGFEPGDALAVLEGQTTGGLTVRGSDAVLVRSP